MSRGTNVRSEDDSKALQPPVTTRPVVEEEKVPTEQGLSPRLRFDTEGRLIPFTVAERSARTEAVDRMFEDLAGIPSNLVEEDREIYRAIDAERPDRPLFEGKY